MKLAIHRALRGTGVLLLAMLTGCAAQQKHTFSSAELRAALLERAPEAAVDELIVPFEVTPAQVRQASAVVARARSQPGQIVLLLHALGDPDHFGLAYAEVTTATAADALAAREGNCLALASVVVGLARSLGLTAFYVDLSHRREQVERRGGLVVRSGHIGAVVRTHMGFGGLEIGERWIQNGNWKRITDVEATAHYYNNRGYELLHDAERDGRPLPWAEATRHFWLATRVRPDFAGAWNNLGVATSRQGRDDEAAEHYARAVELDASAAAPLSNLGSLHLRHGELARAASVLHQAADLDPKGAGIAAKLGRVYLARGEAREAEIWLNRATELDAHQRRAQALLDKVRLKYGRSVEQWKLRPAKPPTRGGSTR